MLKKAKNVFLILLVILFLNPVLYSGVKTQEDHQDFGDAIQQFEQFVQKKMELDRIPGLSIGFMKDDFTWARGFGYSDLENKVKAKPQSSFRMASVSKTFTAIAVLKLAEEGKIDLDEEIQTYVSYFPQKKWPVTVRQLLGHLGGISHYKDYNKEGHFKYHMNTKQAVSVFKDFDLVTKPGTKYNYSSYGFNLLGALIEEASGQSYGDYIQKTIFKPLDMINSRMDSPLDIIPHRVQGYRLINGDIKNSEFVDISSRFAAGGTRSTVIDLLKYGKGICKKKILKPETWERVFTSMTTTHGKSTWYGMGWGVAPLKGHFMVSHGGSQPETRTYVLIFPTEYFAVAVGANLEKADLSPYVNFLSELILNQDLNSKAFVPDLYQRMVYVALSQVFNYGLSRYDFFGPKAAGSQNEISQAFHYFNKYVNKNAVKTNPKETKNKLENGIHPLEEKPFIKIGAHMASFLEKAYGENRLRKYHQSGPLSFFSDYTKLVSNYKFRRKIIDTARKLHKDWERVYTDDLNNLQITAETDIDSLLQRIKKISLNSSIYPDFSEQIANSASFYIHNNQVDKAVNILQMSSAVYPNNPQNMFLLAQCFVLKNHAENSFKFYKKAHSLDEISLDHFIYFAEKLRKEEKTAPLFLLMEILLELYPENAKAHKGAGYIYLEFGKTKNAVDEFKKSLKLDPEQKDIKIILDQLQKNKTL